MTPTLLGRWQTRIFLTLFVGAPLTLLFMALYGALGEEVGSPGFLKLPLLVAYMLGLGLVWDRLYIFLQTFRWDRDWPLAFQFACGIWEGLFVFALFAAGVLPGVEFAPGDGWRFALHYTAVFQCMFWSMFGPMRVLFPRWRFRGGRLL